MFGYVLFNEMFVVFDWEMCCVFFLRKLGYIERIKYIDYKFGFIFFDLNNNIYVCEF